MKTQQQIALACFMLATVFLLCLNPLQALSHGLQYSATLVWVIDGDIVRARLTLFPNDRNVRLSGIDAPETRRGKKAGVLLPECEITQGKAVQGDVAQLLLEKEGVGFTLYRR